MTQTAPRTNGQVAHAAQQSPPEAASVRLVPHQLIHAPPGNRECPLDSLHDLIASLGEHGQLVEVILYPHDGLHGHWWCADGNRRVTALRVLDRPVRARTLEKVPAEAELIALRLTIDANRKAMDKAEVGADVWRWLEITGATQEAAAEAFKFSTGYVSKLLAPFKRGVDPLIRMLRDGQISGTACALVAALTPEQQQRAVEEMRPVAAQQGKVKRDAAGRLCDRLRGRKEKRPKATRFTCGAATVVIRGDAAETLKALHARLGEVLKRVGRDPVLAEVLPGLLK